MSGTSGTSSSVLVSQDLTGSRARAPNADTISPRLSGWTIAAEELVRPLYFTPGSDFSGGVVYHFTSSSTWQLVVETLPIPRHEGPNEALASLNKIERAFGSSASDLARILRVSRPMIYHYRQGMAPSIENFRRLKLIASLADSTEAGLSAAAVLKSPQPEGKTLAELLSAESPDVALIRRILLRTAQDVRKRQQLAAAIGFATPKDREDILRERQSSGKPVYVTDPEHPGKIVQIHPDQSRVRGRMVNRVFVPDEE